MLQKALVLVLLVATIVICTGCGSTANHYIYATIPAANQVAVYREDPNSGVLTQISGSPYAVGDGPTSLVIHPSGKFLYVANAGQNENDISLFTIGSKGTLTEVFPRTSVAPAASQPQLLEIDPNGTFLYVLNSGSNNISVFTIDATKGSLAPLVGSPFPIGLSALNMKLTPSGNFLYVGSGSGTTQLSGLVEGFSVNAGVLQSIGATPTDGINPNGLTIDPTGTYLYVANSGSPSISIFSIASNGGLTEVQGSPISDTYTVPISLIFDVSGKYLYVANQASNNVASYAISTSSGLPSILTTTTTTGAFATEASPNFLAADPNGKYLFVGNQGSAAGIQAFGVSNGSLTTLSTYGVGNTPSSIAVLGK